jgi:hypothetical protein
LNHAITTAGPPGASCRTSAVPVFFVWGWAVQRDYYRSIPAITLLSRFDNAITTVADRSCITSIGATGYARLSWDWTLPACFDLTDGIAPITIVGVAVIAFLTLIRFENTIATGAHRSPI